MSRFVGQHPAPTAKYITMEIVLPSKRAWWQLRYCHPSTYAGGFAGGCSILQTLPRRIWGTPCEWHCITMRFWFEIATPFFFLMQPPKSSQNCGFWQTWKLMIFNPPWQKGRHIFHSRKGWCIRTEENSSEILVLQNLHSAWAVFAHPWRGYMGKTADTLIYFPEFLFRVVYSL